MNVLMIPITGALPFLLFCYLLPVTSGQKDFLNQIEEWNYREGADKVNIQGVKSITHILENWGNSIFWQLKYTLLSHPNALLPELSSLSPVSEAIDNLLKQVHSIKKRLAELNERLNVMSKILFPIQYKALRSQRLSNIHLRRRPVKRNRMYIRRQAQMN
ncbi:hypothetical protein JD844_028206 [Phrynosoma platyrhinos]|uniref:Uncharacterized protein n=1 Tax=Phrynosoma platyrhinos TaxID=52577 RepID=A0ABQ7SHI8_PHRPL|nr:hypothetical protein JD844_028206 [Phrynosoma platyrhinos]